MNTTDTETPTDRPTPAPSGSHPKARFACHRHNYYSNEAPCPWDTPPPFETPITDDVFDLYNHRGCELYLIRQKMAAMEVELGDLREDAKLLRWLESKFAGMFRNSIFWGHDIDGSEMMNMDLRSQPGVIHRAKTVRGLIRLAMEHESPVPTCRPAKGEWAFKCGVCPDCKRIQDENTEAEQRR